ncbi:MAG TPA: prolipoprotein diacylglyceryl transferase [Candidatus Lumbricidophila sp.]|nr:prolipoprotein diacylglyceryl transferase [Candidatus Lumbricidophila sp.]
MAPFSIPSPDPVWESWTFVLFRPWTIHMYAVAILIGIVLAAIIVNHRLTKRGAEPGIALDIVLWCVPLGLIFARGYHVLTHLNDYVGPGKNTWNPFEPGSVWAIWEGGNAIFGALIGGAIGVWIGCKFTGLRFWSFADALIPGLLVAQAIGRLGNYFNHELFGSPTDLPWGLQIESTNPAYPAGLADGTLFHPTFLYELLWNLLGAAILVFFLERKFHMRWGRALAFYLIWYGIGRAFLESIRLDPSDMILGVRSNVWAAWAAIVLGIVLLFVQRRRHTGLEPSVYRSGLAWVPANAAVESASTESDSDSDDEDVETENAAEVVEATSSPKV